MMSGTKLLEPYNDTSFIIVHQFLSRPIEPFFGVRIVNRPILYSFKERYKVGKILIEF